MTQKIIPKKVFKNSHVKIDIIDALLLQNIKNILIRRYPEAEVSINYGQITIKKNLLDRLYIKVFEDRQKNSSYIQTSYADTTSTIGYYYIGLLPNLIIIFLQMVLGRQFKEEVTETILRDLKTKYRTDIQYIDRPIGTIELFLYGLVGVNLVVFLCDYLSINNPFFSFFGWGDYLIVSNPDNIARRVPL